MEQCRTNTYKFGRVEIVVHRPELTAKDREKREESLKRAMMAYGKEMMKRGESYVDR